MTPVDAAAAVTPPVVLVAPQSPKTPFDAPAPQETDNKQPKTCPSEGWAERNAIEMMLALTKTAPRNDVVVPKKREMKVFW